MKTQYRIFLETINPDTTERTVTDLGPIYLTMDTGPHHYLRNALCKLARNAWGGSEMKGDWAICNDPSCEVPLFARRRGSNAQIRIK